MLAGIALYSLCGIPQAVRGLLFVALINSLNTSIVGGSAFITPLFWVAVMLATGSIHIRNLLGSASKNVALVPLLCFVSISIIGSFIVSQFIVVSIFKLLTFWMVSSALLTAFSILSARNYDFSSLIAACWVSIVTISIPLLFVPSIGFFRDGMGFQGVLNHPQGFAIFLGPAFCWAAAHFLSAPGRLPKLFLAFLIVCFVFLFLTRARTGMLAVLTSFMFVSGFLMFRPNEARRLVRSMGVILVLSAFIAPFTFNILAASVSEFMNKGQASQSVLEALDHSRGRLAREGLENFYANPVWGIGFGTARSETRPFKPVYDELLGIPIKASTEKANMFIAALEETGITGFLPFAWLLLALAIPIVRSGSLVAGWVFFCCIQLNLGETTFFSVGGFGLYQWIIMAWVVAVCRRNELVSTYLKNLASRSLRGGASQGAQQPTGRG